MRVNISRAPSVARTRDDDHLLWSKRFISCIWQLVRILTVENSMLQVSNRSSLSPTGALQYKQPRIYLKSNMDFSDDSTVPNELQLGEAAIHHFPVAEEKTSMKNLLR
jgi:hypothetical protein